MRLIDAHAWVIAHCGNCGQREYGICTDKDPVCGAVKLMNKMPTVDAVEVVRCEVCKHKDDGICWKTARPIRDDGYCDEGERKEK